MEERRPHVVIIGGGFGGLNAAQGLANAPVNITLIDRRNYHLFQPLLYQVATAAINTSDIAHPIRSVLAKQHNARVLLAEALTIDVKNRRVVLDDGLLEYDFLIVATGATHSYFGKDWGHLAPGLKTIEDAVEIRRRIFLAYEAAERESDPVLRREWLTFAVVGGGPTGVELAGALAEIGPHTLPHDFRSIDPTKIHVLLFEGLDRVLATYPPELSEKARSSLEKLGVDVRLNTFVTSIDETGVIVKSGDREERIGTRTVLWGAGVQASPLAMSLGAPRDRAGRVQVRADLSIPERPEVFVIGDLSTLKMPDGSVVPGVAQAAIQEGRYVARVISDEARGATTETRVPFRYKDKGNMATIGRASAVIDTKRYKGDGIVAWLLWWVVHIAFLIGFRNRVAVLWHWAWLYFTYKRGARLITGPVGRLPPVAIGVDGKAILPPPARPVTPVERREQPRAAAP